MTDACRRHITFGYSAAMSLKMALATLGLEEPVAILADDFSMGPIDPGDPDQRAQWERDELDEQQPVALFDGFWEQVSRWPGKLVVWMSSRATNELCGRTNCCGGSRTCNSMSSMLPRSAFVPRRRRDTTS